MSDLFNRITSLVENYNQFLLTSENQTIERINKALAKSYILLESELLRKYPAIKENGSLLASQRAILLLGELKELLLINNQSAPLFLEEFNKLLDIANQSGIKLGELLLKMAGEEGKESFVFQSANIPLDALKFASEEQLRRLQRWGDAFSDKATSIIEQGIILGWGNAKVAQYLRAELGVTQARADNIARTSSISAFNQATQATYLANGVEYFQFVATKDDRTCPYCLARNMSVYKIPESRPPLHGRCRCYSLPWKKEWHELGLSNSEWAQEFFKEAKAGYNNPLNYGVAPFEKIASLKQPYKPIWRPD